MGFFQRHRTLNCRGRLVMLDRPAVMGILNVTPDSFFDGGKYNTVDTALEQAGRMIDEGAQIIDIGGMSSRPGAEILSPEEEQQRVLPVIRAVHRARPDAILSIDTLHADTARRAVEAGASIVNDISAGRYDPDMLKTVAGLGTPFVAMHMRGTPADMQEDTHYTNVSVEVLDYLIERLRACRDAGITDVIADPGLGFGKTAAHNFELLKKLEVFGMLEIPLMIGLSRKSMIWKTLNSTPETVLNGTTALHMIALMNGADLLRVHDVREAVECIELSEAYRHSGIVAPSVKSTL